MIYDIKLVVCVFKWDLILNYRRRIIQTTRAKIWKSLRRSWYPDRLCYVFKLWRLSECEHLRGGLCCVSSSSHLCRIFSRFMLVFTCQIVDELAVART